MTKPFDKKRQDDIAGSAVIAVGSARGFVVETKLGDRCVLTAAHCLPALPEPHPWANDSRVWPVLGQLGEEPTVLAECFFVDPVADIAVLGCPDYPELVDQYRKFMDPAWASPSRLSEGQREILPIGALPVKPFAKLSGWKKARRALRKGFGINKTARRVGLSNGTVQRLAQELRGPFDAVAAA
jgi:hypothetical protein